MPLHFFHLIWVIAIVALVAPCLPISYRPAEAAPFDASPPAKGLPDLDIERSLSPSATEAAPPIPSSLGGWSPYDGNLNATVNPPSVTITAPSNGASFPELTPVTISATASGSAGISIVSFLANGSLVGSAKAPPYTITWSYFSAGQYTLTAVARDTIGATGISAPVSITVTGGSGAPSVSITSPANGAQFSAPANIAITANATASPGRTISRVDFYSGATQIGTATSLPYTITWSNLGAGAYSLTAKAIDNAGAQTTSTAISISVFSALPTVSITNPANGSTYTAPVNVPISADATASSGRTISRVDFFYGGANPNGTATIPPYSVTWNSVPVGTHSLTAKATDNFGAASTATAVTTSKEYFLEAMDYENLPD